MLWRILSDLDISTRELAVRILTRQSSRTHSVTTKRYLCWNLLQKNQSLSLSLEKSPIIEIGEAKLAVTNSFHCAIPCPILLPSPFKHLHSKHGSGEARLFARNIISRQRDVKFSINFKRLIAFILFISSVLLFEFRLRYFYVFGNFNFSYSSVVFFVISVRIRLSDVESTSLNVFGWWKSHIG